MRLLICRISSLILYAVLLGLDELQGEEVIDMIVQLHDAGAL